MGRSFCLRGGRSGRLRGEKRGRHFWDWGRDMLAMALWNLAVTVLDPALGFAFAGRTKCVRPHTSHVCPHTSLSVHTQNRRTSLVTQKLLRAGITFLNAPSG